MLESYSMVFQVIRSRSNLSAQYALLLRANTYLLVSALLSIPEIQYRFIYSPVNFRFCYTCYDRDILPDVKAYTIFSSSTLPFSNPFFPVFEISRTRMLRKLISGTLSFVNGSQGSILPLTDKFWCVSTKGKVMLKCLVASNALLLLWLIRKVVHSSLSFALYRVDVPVVATASVLFIWAIFIIF